MEETYDTHRDVPYVTVVDSCRTREQSSFVEIANQLYEMSDRNKITDDMLLSQSYGVWGEQSSRQGVQSAHSALMYLLILP